MPASFPIEENILVLRQDAESSWKWTEKIQKEVEQLKKEQEVMLKLIEKNEEIVRAIKEILNKDDMIEWGRITENTNV
jgi:mevalonate kinase